MGGDGSVRLQVVLCRYSVSTEQPRHVSTQYVELEEEASEGGRKGE
jgi:hypothetical protein